MVYTGQCVSHGTLRTEDLLSAFSAALRSAYAERMLSWSHNQLCDEAESMLELGTYDSDDGIDLIGELQDALNEYAPEGCYFGTHPGDGSDFGFYEVED